MRAPTAPNQTADDGVEATTIVERALERAAAQRESGMELDFEYTTAGVFESLDRDGNVTRTETSASGASGSSTGRPAYRPHCPDARLALGHTTGFRRRMPGETGEQT